MSIEKVTNSQGGGGGGGVTSVAGKTGIVTLFKADITDFSDSDYATSAQGLIADSAEQSANKGSASGYAPLDASSKVPLANLPASVVGGVDFLGLWNASTNTPALSNGSGDNGDFYKVSVAGSTDFGAGSIAFNVGDQVIYNGTTTLWGRLGSDEDDTLQDVYSRGSDVDIDNTQGAIKLSRGVGITDAAFNIVPSTVTPSTNLADGDFHVEDGTIFLYDLARTKFLSSGTPIALQFGKNNGVGNEFLRFGGDARDGDSGAILPWDATIVAMTLKGENNETGQLFDIDVDGTAVETLTAVSSKISDDTLNLDVDAGETINLFARGSGSEVDDPYAIIFVKRRKV